MATTRQGADFPRNGPKWRVTVSTAIAVKERPILFSGPMVRAILEGRKTQTRRILTPPAPYDFGDSGIDVLWATGYIHCPKGIVGDRLWVQESFRVHKAFDRERLAGKGWRTTVFEADAPHAFDHWGKLRPARFMPREYSRITLEITEVRVQRLQEINFDDIQAEGFAKGVRESSAPCQERFQQTWNALNAKRGFGWDANPWVWAITFKKCG